MKNSLGWVLYQDAQVYQQCLLCDSSADNTHSANQSIAAQARDAQQVPNTAQNPAWARPAAQDRAHPSARLTKKRKKEREEKNLRITRTNPSEFAMREDRPSFNSLHTHTHTLCGLLGPDHAISILHSHQGRA
jgi:hypothetical protein